jgi:hypothetical protein
MPRNRSRRSAFYDSDQHPPTGSAPAPFDARAESVFDLATGQLLALTESSRTADKRAERAVAFDHGARTAALPACRHHGKLGPSPCRRAIQTDLIMGLLQTRTWDLKPGEKREALRCCLTTIFMN